VKKLASDRFLALIEWRRTNRFPNGASPRQVADSLSGEELAYKDIPKRFYEDVVAFRHQTQKRRLEVVGTIFLGTVKGKDPRKRLRKPEPQPGYLFAVCGYLSQKCSTMKEAREWLDDRLLRCTYPRGFIVDGRVTVVEKNFQGLKRTVLK
jgi:hypothetical protein